MDFFFWGGVFPKYLSFNLGNTHALFFSTSAGGKFMEGQTISLEDGSTAVVQGVSHGKSSGTKFYKVDEEINLLDKF